MCVCVVLCSVCMCAQVCIGTCVYSVGGEQRSILGMFYVTCGFFVCFFVLVLC